MKVIIDTNIWISFLIGHQANLVKQILTDDRMEIFVCQQLLDEISEVANREKLKRYISMTDLLELFEIMNSFCRKEELAVEAPTSAIRDPKDLYLLSLSDTVKADFIVSGDADLTDLGSYNTARILKLADFKLIIGLVGNNN